MVRGAIFLTVLLMATLTIVIYGIEVCMLRYPKM